MYDYVLGSNNSSFLSPQYISLFVVIAVYISDVKCHHMYGVRSLCIFDVISFSEPGVICMWIG